MNCSNCAAAVQSRDWSPARVVGVISLLVVLSLTLSLPAAQAVLQPGDKAPSFDLQDTFGKPFQLNEKTSDTVLLLFVKPDDLYTTTVLLALDTILRKYPALNQGLRRCIIVSRMDEPSQAKQVARLAGYSWAVLPDIDSRVYQVYRIIATPTVVIVGGTRRVAAVNPGYDPGLEYHVLTALAQERSVILPPGVISEPEKPNMNLQLGRRLAARGLWERALEYYDKARQQGPLAPAALLELAQIYLELNRPDDALQILGQVPANSPEEPRRKQLLQRAQQLKTGGSQTPTPPKITR